MTSELGVAASLWQPLIPVIVGGALAILGGAFTPLLSHYLAGKKSHRERRTARFEQMMEAVYQQDHWLDLRRRSLGQGELIEPGHAPIHRARFIALSDFPDLVLPMRKLDVASGVYETWIAKAASDRINGNHTQWMDGFKEAYTEWITELTNFQNAAAAYIAKERGKA